MKDFEALRASLGALTDGDRIYVLRVDGELPDGMEAVLTRSGIYKGTTTGTPRPNRRRAGDAARTILVLIWWDGAASATQQAQDTIGLEPNARFICVTTLAGLRWAEGRDFKQRQAFDPRSPA